jgi:hypothetical protein
VDLGGNAYASTLDHVTGQLTAAAATPGTFPAHSPGTVTFGITHQPLVMTKQ